VWYVPNCLRGGCTDGPTVVDLDKKYIRLVDFFYRNVSINEALAHKTYRLKIDSDDGFKQTAIAITKFTN